MLIGLTVALLTTMYGPGGFDSAALVWATLAGVVVGQIGRTLI